MTDVYKSLSGAVDTFLKRVNEINEKIAKFDKKLKELREKLNPLESEILELSSTIARKERELHTRLNKAKRVRKLFLQEEDINKAQQLEKDYDILMKRVNEIDKELKALRKKYDDLVAKESKLLEKEMKLEEEKAELYHEREKILSKATGITKMLNSKIAQITRER